MSGHDMWRDRASEAVAALMLLTRLPVAGLARCLPPPDNARAVWAYPLAGAVTGAIGGLAYWLAVGLGTPPVLAAMWSAASMLVATGALHEDGLADFADGLGGTTRERSLEIMRDSRIGAYGVLALLLAIGLRVAAVATIATPAHVAASLIFAGSAGRAAAGVAMASLRPARADGLSATIGRPAAGVAVAGVALAIVTGIFVLEFTRLFGALICSGLASLVAGLIAARRLGGQTGDVLGAVAVVAECAALTALAASLDGMPD